MYQIGQKQFKCLTWDITHEMVNGLLEFLWLNEQTVTNLVCIYLLKVNNRNTRTRCDGVTLVSLLLTLNIFHTLF